MHGNEADHRPGHGFDPSELKADYLRFKEEVALHYGASLAELVEVFFERATHEASKGQLHSANQDGAFALQLAQYAGLDAEELIPLMGFLCELNVEAAALDRAWGYYHLAVHLRDPESPGYLDDQALFDYLEQLLRSNDWKRGLY
jgi:hypothetical protein